MMEKNIFQFGNTYWLQKNGTAMGTSCAVNNALIYVGLLEFQELFVDFKAWMPYYSRFIDDDIGLWYTNAPGSSRAWADFNRRINDWGSLKWTNTGLVDTLTFLDLTIRIVNCSQ